MSRGAIARAPLTPPGERGKTKPSGLPSPSRPPVRPFIVAPKLVSSRRLLTKARILLKADVSELGEGSTDSRIAAATEIQKSPSFSMT
jgi:hypothetical protein